MKIDITQLTEHELIALNRQVVERLRFLQQARAHAKMLEFRVGDRVCFEPDGRLTQFGVLVRYNRKTVTVVTEHGEQWNVSPGLLRRVVDVATATEVPNPGWGDSLQPAGRQLNRAMNGSPSGVSRPARNRPAMFRSRSGLLSAAA